MPLAYDEKREVKEIARQIVREEIEAARLPKAKTIESAAEEANAEVPQKGEIGGSDVQKLQSIND